MPWLIRHEDGREAEVSDEVWKTGQHTKDGWTRFAHGDPDNYGVPYDEKAATKTESKETKNAVQSQ